MSARLATPPDAITGMRTSLAISSHAGRIDADLCAVARDVGHDCRGDTRRAKPLCRFGDGQLAGLDPSFDGEHPVANVD